MTKRKCRSCKYCEDRLDGDGNISPTLGLCAIDSYATVKKDDDACDMLFDPIEL